MQLSHAHLLICRTDNIGDLVLTLPLAGFLKQQFPHCRITFLCRAYAQGVVERCVFVDAVLTLETLVEPEAALRAGGFDVVIFAFPQRKLAQAAKRAKIPLRVGTSHRFYHWLYCNKLAHFSRVHSPLHEAQLNFALLEPLGLKVAPSLAQIQDWYGLRPGAVEASPPAPALRGPTVRGPTMRGPTLLQNNRFNLILHPKSNGNGREWPLASFVELARQLQTEARVQIWISGSAQEGQQLAAAAPELFALPNVASLCGHCTLAQFVDLIAACDGLIASGTGPLHLAAALGRRTLGLFPPIKPIDIARWGALGSRAENLCTQPACRACPGAQACACMAAISVQQVNAVVTRWLNSPS
jgi:ADP-heptose:LPS heptosyltransferase